MLRRQISGVLAGGLILMGVCGAALAEDYPPVTQLDAVVVTADRSQALLREVSSNVTVIGQEQIKASTAQNMEELLSQNGFYTIDQGTSKAVQIRGMRQPSLSNEMHSPVLVLLNGRRIGANNASLMGLANVDRVEIVRGPAAVQYGPSAMGGVINIITKRGLQNDFSATVEGGLGSFGLYKESLALNGGIEGFDFALGVINYSRDDYNMYNGRKRPKSEVDYNTNVNFDAGYNINEVNRIVANINYYATDALSGPSYSTRETYTTWNKYKLSNYNVAFMYDGGTLNRMFNWQASYSFGRDKSAGEGRPEAIDWWQNNNKIDVQSGNVQFGYNSDLITADIGFDYIEYEYKDYSDYGYGATKAKGEYNDFGVYFASKLRLFEQKLIFSLGGRYDHYATELKGLGRDDKEDRFSPSVGVAFLPLEWLKLRTNFSQGFKMAGPDQINGGGGYYVANYDLKPEKSKTWEAGADINWQFINASLTYFNTDWKDKIIAYDLGGWLYQYRNLKSATISGLEFAFSANLGQAFNWPSEVRPYVNLTYMLDRENKDPATRPSTKLITNVPEWMVNFGLTFANAGYDVKANLNAVYTGKMKAVDYRPGYGNPGNGAYINHTGDTVVNLSVEKGLFDIGDYGDVKLRVNVNNIFDSANESYLDYNGPGRNFYVGLIYTY